ncbi:MAG: response regulator [Proteobacteria bacterium]|nr:response regulator [Pseudomonadota bacterium]
MSGEKVMIVEDEILVARHIEAALTNLGYSVVALLTTGEEAVARTGEDRPDIILMDIHLAGGMDGVEAARRIRETHDIPIIFLTAYHDDETIGRAGETESYGYLIKPLDTRELKASMTVALYKAKADQERQALLNKLQEALSEIKRLSGLLPICSGCKKIRDDQGEWLTLERYIQERSEARFSHSLCPDCARRLYPELDWDDLI